MAQLTEIAFGIFSRLLSNSGPQYDLIARGGEGMELADSLASDLHKFLNVPYDCGVFVCRHPDMQV
jgi:glutamate/tyrosine decarboxylase-like PLP-dependent enzyme